MKEPALDQSLAEAEALVQRGHLGDARQIYEAVLSSAPNNVIAKTALETLAKARNPAQDDLVALVRLYNAGQFNTVKERCDALIGHHSNSFDLWNILGAAHNALGQFARASECFNRACSLNPNIPDAHNNLGITLKAQGRFADAVKAYDKALKIKPDYVEAHNNLGAAYKEQGKLTLAIAAYATALSCDPNYAEAHYNMGVALKIQGERDKAVAAFTSALAIKGNYTDAYNNLGAVLLDLGKLDEALAAFTKTLEINPDYPDIQSNIGAVFAAQGRLDEAGAALSKALRANPNCPGALNNMGILLKDQGRIDEAISHYSKALAVNPDSRDAKNNKSSALLLQGELKDGFKLMEVRLLQTNRPDIRQPRPGMRWDGKQSIKGARFLVYQEQGLGDIIQFSRYLPLLAAKGAQVAFFVTPTLHRILKTIAGDFQLITSLPSVSEIDFEAPLMSLPHLLGTTLDTIPASIPYLHADGDKQQKWAADLPDANFRIGICWQGSKTRNDLGRSFPLSLFEPISRIPGVELVSLHKGDGEAQLDDIAFAVTTFAADFDGNGDAFADTAAVMANCDLIITSDTAVAHLAGALGCKTWVLLQAVPNWRWLMNRRDSPWYPDMVLFRQKSRGDWKAVFDEVAHDLRSMLQRNGAARDVPFVQVSWGELIDRISILGIKIENLTAEQALKNVRREHGRLMKCYEDLCPDLVKGEEFRHQLVEINLLLWEVEEGLRQKEALQEFDGAFIALARKVYTSNDERARIKKQIDVEFKSDLTEEKSHRLG